MKNAFFAISIFILGLAAPCKADPIYKSYDKSGKPVYSSAPNRKEPTKHELPEIMKESSKGTLADTAHGQCAQHGGVDCAQGPDTDGSIICQTGYRDVRALFKYTCPTAKLVITQVDQPPGSVTATVVIRNVRPTEASRPLFRLLSPTGLVLDSKGPLTLGGHGIAVYEVYIPQRGLPGGARTPSRNQLLITCGNCG